jgi:hypothetical protein
MNAPDAIDPCEGVAAAVPPDQGSLASASGVAASKRPTCLCVKEGMPGLQRVGHFSAGKFVTTDITPCNLCDGTAISPRARKEAERRGVKPEPSEPPMNLDELSEAAERLLLGDKDLAAAVEAMMAEEAP